MWVLIATVPDLCIRFTFKMVNHHNDAMHYSKQLLSGIRYRVTKKTI